MSVNVEGVDVKYEKHSEARIDNVLREDLGPLWETSFATKVWGAEDRGREEMQYRNTREEA